MKNDTRSFIADLRRRRAAHVQSDSSLFLVLSLAVHESKWLSSNVVYAAYLPPVAEANFVAAFVELRYHSGRFGAIVSIIDCSCDCVT